MPLAWLAHLPGDAARLASKIIDYGHKGQGCFASDATLAADLGIHRVTVNGYMRLLEALEDSHAMTTVTTGRATRTRRLRPLRRDQRGIPTERYICVSNFARNNLTGNRFKVYAYASFCADTKTEFRNTQAGEKCGITGTDTVRLIVRGLEAEGWLTRSQDGGGRHGARYDVHRAPHPDPATPPAPETATVPHPDPATQNTTLGTHPSEQAREVAGGSARRATPVVARGPVENSAAGTFEQAVAAPESASPEPPTKPTITISATAYRVLRHLPLKLSAAQYALASKAIETAVAGVGGDVERIADRVHRHLAGQDVGDPYGWLISRGLRKSPCPAPQCEDGRTWPTGADCPTCHERYADRRGTPLIFRDRATAIYNVTWTCSGCESPGTGEPPVDETCDDCHQAAKAIKAALTEYHLPAEFENGLCLPDRWRCAEDGCGHTTEGARPEHGRCWRCAPKHKRRERTHRRWQNGGTQ
ncbi:hypothetical protein C0216_08830 [Streptomyces globosus]|uniref:Uncharacterized protein n=1 Tax=Streptomyces globosus TaxID=68209 RepID=A0A344TY32_9ACTN|nr:hypothetical protein [Streptomyces globosus]AXE23553.1 hypothetical protein C0216_08830 [Streptomyces globosus]